MFFVVFFVFRCSFCVVIGGPGGVFGGPGGGVFSTGSSSGLPLLLPVLKPPPGPPKTPPGPPITTQNEQRKTKTHNEKHRLGRSLGCMN